ncbi:MAG: hypothetical protein JXB15_10630 [Anaerolineales bacterium]|nr:hypothetical protein [Anaerolineales bacterium]
MKTQLVITDLTRMQRGRVCIAGYDRSRTCIRPVLPPPGIAESDLYLNGKAIIYPFALVELELLQPLPEPPHTEDVLYEPNGVSFIRQVVGREQVLAWSLFDRVSDIFEQPIHSDIGFNVMDCQGPRSLGTIQPRSIEQVRYAPGERGAWDYRLSFTDAEDITYRLKITDLTWHYFCDSLRDENHDPQQISAELSNRLHSRTVYLRIGLSRGWKQFPDRCFLQINAIYTFPDYLDGRNFADFAQQRISDEHGQYFIEETP